VTPRAVRTAVVVVALAAAAIAGWQRARETSARSTAGVPSRIMFVYSSDADDLIAPLIRRFNRQQAGTADEIRLRGVSLASGQAEAEIRDGVTRAVAWMPAASVWEEILDADAQQPWAARGGPSIVKSPEVMAMWHGIANRAFHWPNEPVSWRDIVAVVTSGRSIARGLEFRLGHTNPDFSTSGLFAAISEYYALAGKTGNITIPDIQRTHGRVRRLESSIVHYGEKASDFCHPMARFGPAYVSMVYMQETTLVDCNKLLHKTRHAKLDGIFPSDGTFVADYPYVVLSAPWVSPAEASGAREFGRWLRDEVTLKLAHDNGFRTPQNFATPPDVRFGAASEPSTILAPPPDAAVVNAIREAWRQDRKPANIELVVGLERSATGDQAVAELRQALRRLLREVSDRDRVGMVDAGAAASAPVPLSSYARDRKQLAHAIASLHPTGGVALYDAVSEAVTDIRKVEDESRIDAVIVVTNAPDIGSHTSLSRLLDRVGTGSATDPARIRVFAVTYGKAAPGRSLDAVAKASGGSRSGDLADVYEQIASFF
jgi:Ca-activated chloride channel family protein